MSTGPEPQPIAGWRILASLALVAQIVVLLALKSSLEDESWFVGTVSATVEEGPLMLGGVSGNLTIDMQHEKDDISIDFFGPLRLSHWQDERDSRAVLSEQENEKYDENVNETFNSPSPSTIKSTTFTLIHLGIGFSVLLIFLTCIDLKKQHSETWITRARRFVSLSAMANILVVLILILLVLPASWLGTIAENPKDFSDSEENEAFLAHAQLSVESELGLDGFLLEFEVSGYDVGMVRPANRSALEAEPPLPDSPDAESFMLISGEMRTETPQYVSEMTYFWIVLWIIVPFVLLIQQRVAIDRRLGPIKVYE